jgi:hypothetical protein
VWQALAVRRAEVAAQHVAVARDVVVAAEVRDAVPAEQLWGAPGARRAVGPWAAAWVCHHRSAPAPQPATRFARATVGLQTALP